MAALPPITHDQQRELRRVICSADAHGGWTAARQIAGPDGSVGAVAHRLASCARRGWLVREHDGARYRYAPSQEGRRLAALRLPARPALEQAIRAMITP